MKNIALIVQCYGQEVNGGAEYHCRLLAEHLVPYYNVTVLTNCAADHEDWDNHYKPGRDELNGVEIIRFRNEIKRQHKTFSHLTKKLKKKRYNPGTPWRKAWSRILDVIDGKSLGRIREEWFRTQGPFCPALISFLEEQHSKFDKLIFFTYLYYPTVKGIEVAPGKSILVPTAHDEPELYLPVFDNVFTTPGYILYNSYSEKTLVEKKFHNSHIPNQVVGIGIDKATRFTAKEQIENIDFAHPYFVYIGRMEPNKNFESLIEHFKAYKKQHPSGTKLVLVGKGPLQAGNDPDIIQLGFVEEEIKNTILVNARGLIMPSRFESLSMATLESMALGIPVVANAACEVLKDHIERSQAGFTYRNQQQFNLALEHLRNTPDETMATKGRSYVQENYSWEQVLQKIKVAIEQKTVL